MKEFKERFYRKRVTSRDLVPFQVGVKETDLWVSADRVLEKETRDLVLGYRYQVERYIQDHPLFLRTLLPYPEDPYAPPIVKAMIEASAAAGVGPMATIAGAVSEFVGRDLLQWSDRVIVENGGDIFLKVDRPVTVSVFAGESPLSEKIGLAISPEGMPLGVCASSGTVGHSHSEGNADVVCVISRSAVLADGAATALCNGVRRRRDLTAVPSRAAAIGGIIGGLAIIGDAMAPWGDIELVGL